MGTAGCAKVAGWRASQGQSIRNEMRMAVHGATTACRRWAGPVAHALRRAASALLPASGWFSTVHPHRMKSRYLLYRVPWPSMYLRPCAWRLRELHRHLDRDQSQLRGDSLKVAGVTGHNSLTGSERAHYDMGIHDIGRRRLRQ